MEALASGREILLPADHPDRRMLAEEVHSRPPEAVETPSRAAHIALIVAPEQREAELAHLIALSAAHGVSGPTPEATHFTADLNGLRLKWERHGEFSSYSFFLGGAGSEAPSWDPSPLVPSRFATDMPGTTIFAAQARLLAADPEEPDPEALAAEFGGHVLVGARIGHGAGFAFSDFKVQEDGFSRFLVLNRTFTPRQAGRMMQRLFEIETYRMMAMLALPLAREQSKLLTRVESALAKLTDDIARQSSGDESLLQHLTHLAAEVESSLARSQFRFGACKAYHDLVIRRISELREQKIPSVQTIEEFMVRRFTPAMATCASTAQRLHDLSERVAQASALLSTRVDIAREKQNQMLLASMNRRARLQLRLQRTVEILSVIPITYYMIGLLSYLAKALEKSGFPLPAEIALGIAIPLIAGLVIWAVRWSHHRALAGSEDAGGDL
ncbi:putative membrane-anchored protein [Rhodoligotrophos appendicifer]|uniref:DUF3422 family protein n=1 Tax=Rhodoligotrophos appendicifer TaxID=987056 RepID=UPI001185ABE4|nr:DUF3422 domain-containing protein [Rhodoligotrophos appendicifer]